MADGVSDRYVSSSHHKAGVDDTLYRMLGQDPAEASRCCECGQIASPGYKNPNAPPGTKSVYCRPHFEKLFGDKCAGCNQPIFGEFVTSFKGKFHKQCFSQDCFCERCRKPIIGEVVDISGKTYHSACANCASCNKDLKGSYIERHGSIFCAKCIDEIESSKKGGGMVEVGRVTVGRGGPPAESEKYKIQKETSENVQKGKEICQWCRKQMGAHEKAISFDGKIFHENCFSCTDCGEIIGSGGFVPRDSLAYCLNCAKPGSIKNPCGGCNKSIEGAFILVSGKKWHQGCFVCADCRGPLARGYAERDGKNICSKCASSKPPPKVVVARIPDPSQPERKGGFTIDPRSGKKIPR